MAHTRKKRRKKHRGTQAGTVARPTSAPRSKGPQTKAEGRQLARQRREERLSKPPSWKSAVTRAAFAAVLFVGVAYFLFRDQPGKSVADVLGLSLVAFIIYVPAAYYTDAWRYRRHMAKHGSGPRGRTPRG
jgi:hypothetical protein